MFVQWKDFEFLIICTLYFLETHYNKIKTHGLRCSDAHWASSP
jgi:hypothetical protein